MRITPIIDGQYVAHGCWFRVIIDNWTYIWLRILELLTLKWTIHRLLTLVSRSGLNILLTWHRLLNMWSTLMLIFDSRWTSCDWEILILVKLIIDLWRRCVCYPHAELWENNSFAQWFWKWELVSSELDYWPTYHVTYSSHWCWYHVHSLDSNPTHRELPLGNTSSGNW